MSLTVCDPIDCSMPGPSVLHYLRVFSDSCPLSWWCYLTILSSATPFSSCLQSFPASGSFPMSQLFASGGQSIGVSVSASVLPMNIKEWFPLGGTVWISLKFKGLLSLLQHHISKASILPCSAFFVVQLSHLYMTTTKTIALTIRNFVSKVMSLLFNMLSRLVITFFSFKEQVSFSFHGCSYLQWFWSCSHLQWFWSPPK